MKTGDRCHGRGVENGRFRMRTNFSVDLGKKKVFQSLVESMLFVMKDEIV